MSLVTVARFGNMDALVITENGDAAADTVVIYVNVVSAKETDGSVNCVKRRQGDGD
jgi:hypothetical protein